jgi:hypothetical protein
MNDKNALHVFVGMTTDVAVLLRELCIVALFCLLVFWPDAVKSRLTRLGVSKVTTPVGEIDITGAGGTVANLNRGILDAISRLQQIQAAPNATHTGTELQPIIDYLKSFQQEAATTDETIKANLVTQQATSEQTSPQSTKTSGWLFVGHVSQDKLHWVGDIVQSVSNALSPTLASHETFNVTTTVYLRADAAPGHHFTGKVIGIVPANGQVQVISDPDYSSAIAGGWFLWVKVQPLQ